MLGIFWRIFKRDNETVRACGAKRSGKWKAVRRRHIENNPSCMACGRVGSKDKPNHVHHRIPFHVTPSFELEPSNLMTMCPRCHLFIGHFDDWRNYNHDIDAMCEHLLDTKYRSEMMSNDF